VPVLFHPECQFIRKMSLMRLLLHTILMAFLLSSSVAANTDSAAAKSTVHKAHPPETTPTILVMGDSISAAYGLEEKDGWVALLEETLRPDYPGLRIVNASISGETTGGALQRLPLALEKFQPTLMVIELGGNDALRGQSLKQMRENLSTMVKLAEDYGAGSVILGMRIPTNYGAVYTERFFNSFATVAENTGAELLPFFLEPIARDRSYFQADGVHPTKAAQPLMLEHVLSTISTALDSQ